MPEILRSRLGELRTRLHQAIWLSGVSWTAAVGVGVLLLVGWTDWLWHLDDSGVRLILAVLILAAIGWVGWRRLVRPLRVPVTDVDLALQVESRYPGFKDSLASSVEFLERESDPTIGSPAMQRRVVADTLRRLDSLDSLDFSGIVQLHRVRRVAVAAAGVCLTALLIVALHPAEAGLALRRLALPFATQPWPHRYELRLVNEDLSDLDISPTEPLRVAQGETLEFYVINAQASGRLPDQVFWQQRQDDQLQTDPLPRAMLRDGGHGTREAAAVSLQVKGPLEFRVLGGDDPGTWHRIEAVPPPFVEQLQLTVTPPAYTKQPVRKLPAGVGQVEGLVGSKVLVQAVVNKPLGRATLRLKDQLKFPLTVQPDGVHVQGTFELKEAGEYTYWLDLADKQGFENAQAPRYAVRAVHDALPEVTLDRPETDGQVTADAEVPVVARVRDDLGVRLVRLQWRVGSLEAAPRSSGTQPLFEGPARPTEHTARAVWPLAPLQLAPGTQILMHIEALDDYDLGAEHIGRSLTRTLTIVSAEDKSQELADRQVQLLRDIERAAREQTDALSRTAELKLQLDTAGELRPADLDLLKNVETQQKELNRLLSEKPSGVGPRARELLEEHRANNLPASDLQRGLEQLSNDIDRLQSEFLPGIEQELRRARAAADVPGEDQPQKPEPPESKPDAALGEALGAAARDQKQVLSALEDLRQQLAQSHDQRDVARELGEVVGGQKELQKETGELAKRTVTKSLSDLTPQEQADVARLAQRQEEQAGRFEKLQRRMEDILSQQDGERALDANPLEDALEQAQTAGTVEQLRSAARAAARNNVAEAAEHQDAALRNLEEMQDLLSGQAEADTEMLVKKMEQAQSDIEELRKKEEELLQKVHDAENLPETEREHALEQLRKEQQQLARQTGQLARRLRRMKAERSAAAASRAAQRLNQAEEKLGQRNGGDAQEAEAQQQEALEELDQAERELAEEKREAEEQLAQETLERAADELAGLRARQQQVLDETLRLDGLRQKKGSLSRGELKSLRDLADVQRNVRGETLRIVEALKAAEVFALALEGGARDMEKAVGKLEQRETGLTTQQYEEAARQRFDDLLAALAPDEDADKPQPAPMPPEGEQAPPPANDSGPQRDGIPMLAQLKMLRSLQVSLNTRLRQLAERAPAEGPLPAEDQAAVQELAAEQGRLADLMRNMTKFVPAAEDEKPEEKDDALDNELNKDE